MRILITGGAGLVGSHAAEIYANRGDEVVVLDNLMRSQLFGNDKESVDIVCVGEGEEALLELCNSIESNKINYSIKNLWFKTKDGRIIKNERRTPLRNLDELPLLDKELFARHVPIKNYYLAVHYKGVFICLHLLPGFI